MNSENFTKQTSQIKSLVNNQENEKDAETESLISKESSTSNSKDFLEVLFQDPLESKQFEKYLESRGQSSLVEFLWACNGIMTMGIIDEDSKDKLVKCIYQKYIFNGSLLQVLNSRSLLKILERLVNDGISLETHLKIFQEISSQIQEFLVCVIYPKFYVKRKSNWDYGIGKIKEEIILNEDGLPNIQPILRNEAEDCTKQPHQNPKEFADKLCEKLMALGVNPLENEITKNYKQKDKIDNYESPKDLMAACQNLANFPNAPIKSKGGCFQMRNTICGAHCMDSDNEFLIT